MAALPDAVARRRTFAIIAHPDAGKTTLTEKLLLFGGAIHLAGQVKAKGERRRARSDWMKIEQARGISVSTSVMTFHYDDLIFNLLDTPGHEDFSEDTYRTLTAVDSAVMVIDAAKGIEAQTRKLFEVCRMRDVPIATFINKVDREGRDPFELMDEIADQLALDVTPLNWPIGQGSDFRGCYNLVDKTLAYFLRPEHLKPDEYAHTGREEGDVERLGPFDLTDPRLGDVLGQSYRDELCANIELVKAAMPAFDVKSFREGHLTPVYFGTALKTLGVEDLLRGIALYAPPPRSQPAQPRAVEPKENNVSGFVFKVQANMDPNHRDRVAFMRLCSGKFKRGMKLKQVATGKSITISSPVMFFAENREIADEAWPGDIIGIPNHGQLRVGDSLTDGPDVRFTGIPNFAPEILRRVMLDDPMRAKQLKRALEDMAEEGVTQIFKPNLGSSWIVGVVGQLQLDVLASRLDAEYKIPVRFENAPYETARWVASDDAAELKRFINENASAMSEDRDGAPVYLARNGWELNYTQQNWPKIRFTATRERH